MVAATQQQKEKEWGVFPLWTNLSLIKCDISYWDDDNATVNTCMLHAT